jgi:nitroimidazol reductase NimA-like FMN-containing flavoprotein (pyridoxamine 5'-phosphate oxidase superfamily)
VGGSPAETTNLDIYGSEPLPWSRAAAALASARGPKFTFFLGTVGSDRTPHAAGVGAIWLDDALWFTSGPKTRKARNLAANPNCTVSSRLTGIDVVLAGRAARTTDAEQLEALARVYREGGWPAEVKDDAFTAPFSAPSAGPPPWHLYRMSVETVFGVATAAPHGATRWRFAS